MENILLFSFTTSIGENKNLQMTCDDNGMLHIIGRFGGMDEHSEDGKVWIDYPSFYQCAEDFRKRARKDGIVGIPGELEHPVGISRDKITLENISHKIVDLVVSDCGDVTGEIVIMDTPKGRIAKAIIDGGLPLYISLRAECDVQWDNMQILRINLTKFITFDLVSQASLALYEKPAATIAETNKQNTSMNKEKQKKRNKKYESLNGKYKVDQKKRAVVYFIVSKGEVIAGVAKCNEGEVFDLELGRQIAYRRAHYNQRERDLFLLRMFIDDMKSSIDAFKDAHLLYCKHYEIALQRAAEEEKLQLAMMRDLRREIDELIKYGHVLTEAEREALNPGEGAISCGIKREVREDVREEEK